MIRLVPLLLLPLGLATNANDPAPTLPPASLALRIEAPDTSSPWKMIVTNTGNATVRFAADGRLLRLSVLPPEDEDADPPPKGRKPKPKKPVECKLPLGLRPGSVVEDRVVLLTPGARYEEIINPALYCFGRKQREALVAGAEVSAKLGFEPGRARGKKPPPLTPPFIGEPLTPDAGVLPVKELLAAPFKVAAPPPPQELAAQPPPSADPGAPRLEISAASRIEATDARSVDVTVTVTNRGTRPTKVHLRRDDVTFQVDGPGGSMQCGAPVLGRASPPESFVTLRAGGKESFAVRLFEPCPDGAFDQPGLYSMRATITLSDAGEKYGFHALTGTATQKEPTLVRVNSGTTAFYATAPQVFGAPAK